MTSSGRAPMRIAIVGGGPAGCACALELLRGAREGEREIEVRLFEPKRLGRHYNQCAGVLTPGKVEEVLARWEIALPNALVQREVRAYVLHAERNAILLESLPDEPPSFATRRIEFDQFLELTALLRGAELNPDRLTHVEFDRDGVVLYTEGATCRADYVVGAFGLDPGAGAAFAHEVGYRPPPHIDTIVTKLETEEREPVPGLLGDRIHAYVPRLAGIEFGALVPKGDHISVIVSGRGVALPDMERFLRLPQVARRIPEGYVHGDCFRGAFPTGLARRIHGPRYLMVGDAAGLVRPLKGGGIHAGLLTGSRAGQALLAHGPTAAAGAAYLAASRDLKSDIIYGKGLRLTLQLLTSWLRMEPVIECARDSEPLRRILYGCVSGAMSYRDALRRYLSPCLFLCVTRSLLGSPLGRGPEARL